MNLSVQAPQELKGVMGIAGLPGIHYKGDGFKHLSSSKNEGGLSVACFPSGVKTRTGHTLLRQGWPDPIETETDDPPPAQCSSRLRGLCTIHTISIMSNRKGWGGWRGVTTSISQTDRPH